MALLLDKITAVLEPMRKTPTRLKKILNLLAQLYPDPRSELDFATPYQLLVAVVLSAQCTDKKVNQVTPALFARYPDFNALARAPLSELEQLIRPINYCKTKARHLLTAAQQAVSAHGGEVPTARKDLTALPGVGQKTANVVLGELGVEPCFPVDTHVFRVARRLGLSTGATPSAVEGELTQLFPSAEWRNLHHRLIFHGRRVCKARTPQCSDCALRRVCPFDLKTAVKGDQNGAGAQKRTGF
jgi:endonuclease-3